MTANWTGDPTTWTNGELTAAELNTEIRDRLDWIKAALALHGVTSASVLGALVGARYGARLSVASVQCSDGNETGVNFDTEDWDDDTFWAASPNPGRLTIPPGGDGTYAIVAGGSYEQDGNGKRLIWLQKNGTETVGQVDRRNAVVGAVTPVATPYDEFELAAGDYVRVRLHQNSNSSLSCENVYLVARRLAG